MYSGVILKLNLIYFFYKCGKRNYQQLFVFLPWKFGFKICNNKWEKH